MDLLPYPPDWSREHSPEILELWQKYSRHTWIRCCLLVRDDDRQASWRITAIAGYLAILLVLLLFLDTLSAKPAAKIAFEPPAPVKLTPREPEVSTRTKLEIPIVDVSYAVEMDRELPGQVLPPFEPVVERPVPAPQEFIDPFEQFSPPPAEPEPPSLPPNFTPFMPVRVRPELHLESRTTDLVPDADFAEHRRTQQSDSYVLADARARDMAGDVWNRFSDAHLAFESPTTRPWVERPDEWLTDIHAQPGSREAVDGKVSQTLTTAEGVLRLTKRVPAKVSPDSVFSYELLVENLGSRTIEHLRVFESIDSLKQVLEVRPAAAREEEQIVWTVTGLEPQQSRTLQVTCRAAAISSVFHSEATVEVTRTLAAATHVFVPDVMVSITLPVEVPEKSDFSVRIVVENRSEKTFTPSELRISLLNGIQQQGETTLTRTIDVPGPGKSLEIPLTLTAQEAGEAVLEAFLDLEKALMVPVRAHTMVSAEKTEKPRPQEKDASTPQQTNRLAVNAFHVGD